MAEVKPLQSVDFDLLRLLIHGYISHEKYVVSREETDDAISFTLRLVRLDSAYVKSFELGPIEHYQRICDEGCSLAAHDNGRIVGIALCEPHNWNQSLVIQEFHVLKSHQGKGIGRMLIEAVINKTKDAKRRIITCETQNTNIPAIRFYQHMGFQIDALDLSLYTNHDWPDGEIALWMKRKLP